MGYHSPPPVPKKSHSHPVLLCETNRPDGLTSEEGKVMDALVNAVNDFVKLDRQHPNELSDFVDGIHKCQSVLGLRIIRRDYPQGWPIK